ncbi:unnamed protein product [Cuscuta europaea]|uniref:Retrotransposon gag domain-containing protein n=1 Tax=Cuscuta europaea TaxID=41803 RepID=A0A9P1E0M6_CUSEU|nr:unnamed protein product [Cuscuta europaea]
MAHDSFASTIPTAAMEPSITVQASSSAVLHDSTMPYSSQVQPMPPMDISSPFVRRHGPLSDPVLPAPDSYKMFGMPQSFSWTCIASCHACYAFSAATPCSDWSFSFVDHDFFFPEYYYGVQQSGVTSGSLYGLHLLRSAWHISSPATPVRDIASLLGVIDGSVSAPPQLIPDVHRREVLNPEYHYWLKIDQAVRSWIFTTLSRDILMEVYDLKFSACIWQCLETRFMFASLARSMELKRQLSHIKKNESQSIDQYLLEIQILVDNLNSINSPVSNRDLIEYTILGLGLDYESLITTLSYIPGEVTLETLRPILQT